LADSAAVDKARKQIEALQGGRDTETRKAPLVDLNKD